MGEHPQTFHDFGALGQGLEAHGTRKNYAAGCRCLPCRSVESCYQAMRAQARARGLTAWVDAGPARAHIASLKAQGVGLRQVAALADVSFRTVQAVQNGRPRVTRSIEARILQTKPVVAGAVLVNSYRTFHRLRILLQEGYTVAQLARWLRVRPSRLRRRSKRVTAGRASEVKRWFDRLMAE